MGIAMTQFKGDNHRTFSLLTAGVTVLADLNHCYLAFAVDYVVNLACDKEPLVGVVALGEKAQAASGHNCFGGAAKFQMAASVLAVESANEQLFGAGGAGTAM